MVSEAEGERRTVRLVDVPVALYRESQQHVDDLLREVVLMAGYEAANGAAGTATRLADTADRHRAERAALTLAAEPTVAAADAEHVTIEYDVALSSADHNAAWGALLEELTGLCRDGAMLVVPAADEVVAFSRWCCEEFVRQLRYGARPRPWAASRADDSVDA